MNSVMFDLIKYNVIIELREIFSYISCEFKAVSLITAIFSVIVCPVVVFADNVPLWWENDLGKQEVVLPGFEALKVVNKEVLLGVGRKYLWKDGVLPQSIYTKGNEYVFNNDLAITVDNSKYILKANSFDVVKSAPDHVIIKTKSNIPNKLDIEVLIRIEYDGLAFVTVNLIPNREIIINELYNEIKLKSNSWTRMQLYELDKVHRRQKQVVFYPEYKGEVRSVVAFVDGDRSFWWFVDSYQGWEIENKNVTEVVNHDTYILLKQKIINKNYSLTDKKTIKFQYLVTPIKKEIGNQKKYRFARRITEKESAHHGVNFWWINAFAHQNYPYTSLHDDVKEKLSADEVAKYPGLFKNRMRLNDAEKKNITLLPYFSAHTLNHLDPVYSKYKKQWAIHPIKKWRDRNYDPPFELKREDIYLSHNSPGYSNYLLYRFNDLIDELGMQGLYFDQGSPFASIQLSVPNDQKYKSMSSDILSLRSFYKRLANLFYLKGKKSLIFVHNSNSAIVPAFTFVSSMVQGEIFEHRLKDFDYMNSIDIDEIRSRLTGVPFGLTSIWQELIYANDRRLRHSKRPFRVEKEEWLKSSYYLNAYNKFMALALLHDIPVWAYAPITVKNKIYDVFDWVVPEESKFIGYWDVLEMNESGIYYSAYINQDTGKLLLVVANIGKLKQSIDPQSYIEKIFETNASRCEKWNLLDIEKKNTSIVNKFSIEDESFRLIRYQCAGDADANL